MKLQNQGNFYSFKSYSFKKNIQLLDSAYTPGEREQKYIWNENHSSWEARKGSGGFPPPLFSLCRLGGLWTLLQTAARKGPKGVLDMFLDTEKR